MAQTDLPKGVPLAEVENARADAGGRAFLSGAASSPDSHGRTTETDAVIKPSKAADAADDDVVTARVVCGASDQPVIGDDAA